MTKNNIILSKSPNNDSRDLITVDRNTLRKVVYESKSGSISLIALLPNLLIILY